MDITAPSVHSNLGLGRANSGAIVIDGVLGAGGGKETSILLRALIEEDNRLCSLQTSLSHSILSSSKLLERRSSVDVEPRIPVEALAIDSRRFCCGLNNNNLFETVQCRHGMACTSHS